MFNGTSFVPSAAWRPACALCVLVALLACDASAEAIDVSLNVFYTDPADAGSGGTWEVVAKTDSVGLAALRVLLTNTATAILDAPRGTVNGTNPAGFSIFANTSNPEGFRDITIGQAPRSETVVPPREQSVFYGVGTLTNGAPNYPGKPAGTNSIGPAFTSLTAVQDVPWAVSDPFMNPQWATAARLTSGTFGEGVTPGFFESDEDATRGNLFTSLGTSTVAGTISSFIEANTIVRTNFVGPPLPDYNDNGFVDAADFVLWRKTFGAAGVGLPADGNNNGTVDDADYLLWRTHFGAVAPPPGQAVSISPVPEPTSMTLLALGAMLFAQRRRRSPPKPSARTRGGASACPLGPPKTASPEA